MLELDHITCRRGPRLLFSAVEARVAPGEWLHLRGANGSGKTSLLRIVAGLAPAEGGVVRWRGMPIGDEPERYRDDLLWLGHAPALKDELTALENLELACALAGDGCDEEAACDALDRLGLKERWHLPARSLSQGQRRRAALARLWLTRRPLWLLDEPLASLDAQAAEVLEERLAEHLASGGTLLATTHQPLALAASHRLDLDAAALSTSARGSSRAT